MALRKKNENKDDGHTKPKATVAVVIHARPMDKQQEQRLSTAVDALLAEWVRQEMGRAK